MTDPTQGIPEEIRDNVLIEDLHPALQMIAEIVGIEGALRISAECGGTSLYIPKVESALRNARERAMVNAFTGDNYQDLAKKYRVSDRYVRSVIEKARKAIRTGIGAQAK